MNVWSIIWNELYEKKKLGFFRKQFYVSNFNWHFCLFQQHICSFWQKRDYSHSGNVKILWIYSWQNLRTNSIYWRYLNIFDNLFAYKLNRWRYIFKYFGVISRHTFLSLQLHGDTSNFSSKTIKTKIKWNEKMIWSICHKLIISYMVLSSKVIISGSRNWARSNSKKIKIVYVFRFVRNNSKSFFGS